MPVVSSQLACLLSALVRTSHPALLAGSHVFKTLPALPDDSLSGYVFYYGSPSSSLGIVCLSPASFVTHEML